MSPGRVGCSAGPCEHRQRWQNDVSFVAKLSRSRLIEVWMYQQATSRRGSTWKAVPSCRVELRSCASFDLLQGLLNSNCTARSVYTQHLALIRTAEWLQFLSDPLAHVNGQASSLTLRARWWSKAYQSRQGQSLTVMGLLLDEAGGKG